MTSVVLVAYRVRWGVKIFGGSMKNRLIIAGTVILLGLAACGTPTATRTRAHSNAPTTANPANGVIPVTTANEIQCAWWVADPSAPAGIAGDVTQSDALSAIVGTNGNVDCNAVPGDTVAQDNGDEGSRPSVLQGLTVVCTAPDSSAAGDLYEVFGDSASTAAANATCRGAS
jgi:hypothetical protein